jgi:Tetratricopeptide repeat
LRKGWEAKLGKDHPDLASTLSNLGLRCGNQGNTTEAEAHPKRALAIQQAKLGKEHPEVAGTVIAYWAPFVVVGEGSGECHEATQDINLRLPSLAGRRPPNKL